MSRTTVTRTRAGAEPGGWALTSALVLTLLVSAAADLNETHLFNPAWPPHAVFHDAAMLNLLAGVVGVSLWLLWRPSREPDVAAWMAWLLPSFFWSGFFWISLVLPDASLRAMPGVPGPSVAGVEVLPNVVAACALILLSTFGLWRRKRASGHAAPS